MSRGESRQRDADAGRLSRRGTVRCVGGQKAVVFDAATCAGCDGRCGVSLARLDALSVDTDLPLGSRVAVEVPVRALLAKTALVLGLPTTATVAAALAAGPWGDWLVPVALLISVAGVVIMGRFARSGDALETCRG
ncbi:MAG: SoxR reducing system RseC family protein [Pseudomonadales bacterium]|nr:SoxR reducing system RseC family protein [Pseudomonadales bacterium]